MNGRARAARSTCLKGSPGRCTSCRAFTTIISGVAFLFFLQTTQGAELYKWVDERGNIHFSDHAPGPDAEKLTVTLPEQPDDTYQQQLQEQNRVLDILYQERREKAASQAQAEVARKQRQTNCALARQNLEHISTAKYLYEETADPDNPRILSEAERRVESGNAIAAVSHWCDG